MKEEQRTEAPEQPTLPGMEPEEDTAAGLAAENERLKAELNMRTAVYDIQARLTEAGARRPALLAESARESFQFSEDGKLANASAILDDLRRKYPEQFAVPPIDAAAGRNARPTLTKEALARMTIEEVQRLDWDEVRTALAQ